MLRSRSSQGVASRLRGRPLTTSAGEVRAALDVAIGWGWIDPPHDALATLDHALKLIWGLTRSK